MLFDALPDDARLWLLALETAPGPAERAQLEHGLQEILAQWRHKGRSYPGAFALLQDQIIAIAEPTLGSAPSGCAIDGMLRKAGRLLDQLGLPRVDPAQTVLARLGGHLRPIPKAALGPNLENGTLTASTPVLDLSLYTLGDLRKGGLEAPLASTWIARRFPVAG